MSAIYESDCPECDGDGYQERFNDDQDGVISWLCPACDGTGKRPAYQPTAQEWADSMGEATP